SFDRVVVGARGQPERVADEMNNARLNHGLRPHVLDDVGQALQPVADQEEHIAHTSVAQVGQHAHPELGALAADTHPQAQHVLAAVHGDADGGVYGPVGDLPVPDLDHDRVDEHRDVHAI